VSSQNDNGLAQTVILDTRQIEVLGKDYASVLASCDTTWMWIDKFTSVSGSLWVLARNWYDADRGELLPMAHDLISRIRSLSTFKLKNILMIYREMLPTDDGKSLAYGHFLIPFFVKSIGNYYFDKDSIREPHIFKDIEWGKRTRGKSGYNSNHNGTHRETSRYSPKGRDPGNVIYKTLRNSEGYVLAVNELADEEILEKIVKVSTKTGDVIRSNITNHSFRNIVEGLARRLFEVGPVESRQ